MPIKTDSPHPNAQAANDSIRKGASIISRGGRPTDLLPMFHALQDELGYVPSEQVPAVAAALNLSRAEVHGVLTYYHHFRQTPPGRHVVQVCRAEACQACGADDVLAHTEHKLACAQHTTRSDGWVTLEPVYCLGLCASAPAIQIDERPYGRVTRDRLDRLLSDLDMKP